MLSTCTTPPRRFELPKSRSKRRITQTETSFFCLKVHICPSMLLLTPFEECAGETGWKCENEGGRVETLADNVEYKGWITVILHEQQQRLRRSEWEMRRRRRRAGSIHPIFFVSLQSAVQKVPRHFLVFIQPLNNKRLKPPAKSRTCLRIGKRGEPRIRQDETFFHFFSQCKSKSCYSRRIFRHPALEEGQVFAVLVVQPLDLEVQVHVICTLAQAVSFML